MLLALLSPLGSAAMLWLVKTIVDDVFVAGNLDQLAWFAATYLAIVLAKNLLSFISNLMEASVIECIVQNMRVDLFKKLVSLSPGSLGERTPGDQLTLLTGDADRVEYLVYTGLLSIISNIFTVVFFVGVLVMLSWKLTLCALVVGPFLFLISAWFAPRIRKISLQARHEESNWISVVEECLGSLPLLHAFSSRQREAEHFDDCNTKARQAELHAVKLQSSMSLLIETAVGIGGLTVLVLGATEIQKGNLSVGTLIAFLGSVGSLYGPISSLAKVRGRFERAAAAGERLAAVFDTRSQVAEATDAKELAANCGKLEIRDVSFGYAPDSPVLKGVSLTVEPGETVAIVGSSGGGKSTLVRLALRMHDPDEGAVLIDGVDIRTVTLQSLARAIAPVFQESYLINGSIESNLRYGDTEVSAQVLKEISLACHVDPFAMATRSGYASSVGPLGNLLSGGQRQRIALARALIRNAPIVILDEATASVDSETEKFMQDAISRFAGTRTMLIVAHRLSSVLQADRVIVLDNGRIVQTGSPSDLLAKKGRCSELFAPQLAEMRIAV